MLRWYVNWLLAGGALLGPALLSLGLLIALLLPAPGGGGGGDVVINVNVK